jgi:type VI secretion system protein ImpE
MPAQLMFSNGGETVALVPTRYPGSQDSADGLICLARKTEWSEIGADRWAGLGQRVLVTDAGEHDLMGVRNIVLDEVAASTEDTSNRETT